MKNSKKILIVAMSMIMIIATIIPSFAISNNFTSFNNIPGDIGSEITTINNYDDKLYKYYVVINVHEFIDNEYYISFDMQYVSAEGYTTITSYNIVRNYNSHFIYYGETNISTQYSFLLTPYIMLDNTFFTGGYLYIPIYIRNIRITSIVNNGNNIDISIYGSTTDESVIAAEAFQLGYSNGYETGYREGIIDSAGYQSDLNLVEHCEQLLGTFVGDDYARYITPLCLALVVILVYFLFIRWLLALVKSKNVTRVADIIVCTACIIMLVIMYSPMLDLTIHQAQTVYQITADTVVGG